MAPPALACSQPAVDFHLWTSVSPVGHCSSKAQLTARGDCLSVSQEGTKPQPLHPGSVAVSAAFTSVGLFVEYLSYVVHRNFFPSFSVVVYFTPPIFSIQSNAETSTRRFLFTTCSKSARNALGLMFRQAFTCRGSRASSLDNLNVTQHCPKAHLLVWMPSLSLLAKSPNELAQHLQSS